jgi:hypothetical protein
MQNAYYTGIENYGIITNRSSKFTTGNRIRFTATEQPPRRKQRSHSDGVNEMNKPSGETNCWIWTEPIKKKLRRFNQIIYMCCEHFQHGFRLVKRQPFSV